jgi:hypothetical protein
MNIASELLVTRDFHQWRGDLDEILILIVAPQFGMQPLSGPAARNKGMALFSRRIDGQYAMIGRQDNENLFGCAPTSYSTGTTLSRAGLAPFNFGSSFRSAMWRSDRS